MAYDGIILVIGIFIGAALVRYGIGLGARIEKDEIIEDKPTEQDETGE